MSLRLRLPAFGLLALAAVGALAPLTGCSRRPRPPNVVVLILDTVRRDHLGTYGYTRETSPTLDLLAGEATLYEAAVSAAPWTLPSHASIFTGLPPSQHQAHHEHLALGLEHVTLAEHLRAAGFETAGFTNNPWLTARTGMSQGFDHFAEIWRDQVSEGTFNINVFVDPDVHGFEDAGAAATLAAIRSWLDGRDDARPFFLFINLIEAHTYYHPPGSYRDRFTDRPLSVLDVKRANRDFMKGAYGNSLRPDDLATAVALYDGEIAYLDSWLDQFLGLLRERRLLDASLLVVTSDHGEGFGEHELCQTLLVDHQLSLHEELLAVPLIIRYPRDTERPSHAGVRIAEPVSSLDIVPTVLDVVGAVTPPGLPGANLAAGSPPADRQIYSEYYRPLVHMGLLDAFIPEKDRVVCLSDRRLVALRAGSRKVIVASDGGEQAYDLARDPSEAHPVSPGAAEQQLLRDARSRLEKMAADPNLPPPRLQPAQREALRSLGYLR